jgi:hypothetical protein
LLIKLMFPVAPAPPWQRYFTSSLQRKRRLLFPLDRPLAGSLSPFRTVNGHGTTKVWD